MFLWHASVRLLSCSSASFLASGTSTENSSLQKKTVSGLSTHGAWRSFFAISISFQLFHCWEWPLSDVIRFLGLFPPTVLFYIKRVLRRWKWCLVHAYGGAEAVHWCLSQTGQGPKNQEKSPHQRSRKYLTQTVPFLILLPNVRKKTAETLSVMSRSWRNRNFIRLMR